MNEAITALCEKFGTTVEYLIATMSRYYKTSTVVTTAIWSFVLISCVVAVALTLRHEFKKNKEDGWYDVFDDGWSLAVVVVCGIFAIIGVGMTLGGVSDCIMANTNPEAYTIQQILKALK